jgi:hypothetical protein
LVAGDRTAEQLEGRVSPASDQFVLAAPLTWSGDLYVVPAAGKGRF